MKGVMREICGPEREGGGTGGLRMLYNGELGDFVLVTEYY